MCNSRLRGGWTAAGRLARRGMKVVRVVTTWSLIAAGTALGLGMLVIMFMGTFVWDADAKPAAPSPSPSETGTRITWMPSYQACADGWGSPSIGQRGACSHHGGVTTYYESTPGSMVTWCPPRYQPKTLERAQELLGTQTAGQVACDVDNPDMSKPGLR
ncbi:hypothetical protein ACFVZD_41440 [Streptomyces sp. NPDC058287]|uniref:hypothetical protein n=1 Tax=Streptomyces sp. NPDC058287 TaxID=3346423 RepID=UPI0036E3EF84